MPVVVPSLPEIFEDAYERAGVEMRSGYELASARRSFNFLTLEWQNRGLNLWTVESGVLDLEAGTAAYVMPDGTVDLLEHQLRTGEGEGQSDRNLNRIGFSSYAKRNDKNSRGEPNQVFVERLAGEVRVTFYPVPDRAYGFFYYRLAGTPGLAEGIGGEATDYMPPRWIPALAAGLAYHIAVKKPEVADRVPFLKEEYEYQWQLAALEDEEDVSVRFYPHASIYVPGEEA